MDGRSDIGEVVGEKSTERTGVCVIPDSVFHPPPLSLSRVPRGMNIETCMNRYQVATIWHGKMKILLADSTLTSVFVSLDRKSVV